MIYLYNGEYFSQSAGGVRCTGAGGAPPANPDVDSSRGAMPAPQGAFARRAFYLAYPTPFMTTPHRARARPYVCSEKKQRAAWSR